MVLVDYLDKGASLGLEAPCLTMDGKELSYGDVQRLSYRVARGLSDAGIAAGEKVAILSGNDPSDPGKPSGNDTLDGAGGNDTLLGADGNDGQARRLFDSYPVRRLAKDGKGGTRHWAWNANDRPSRGKQ